MTYMCGSPMSLSSQCGRQLRYTDSNIHTYAMTPNAIGTIIISRYTGANEHSQYRHERHSHCEHGD